MTCAHRTGWRRGIDNRVRIGLGVLGAVATVIGLIDVPDQLQKWATLWQETQLSQDAVRTSLVVVGLLFILIAVGSRRRTGTATPYPRDSPTLGPITAKLVGKKFSDTDIWVDGVEYNECTFRDCTFHYAGRGAFVFIGCRFEGTRRFYSPDGAVTETIALLKGLGLLGNAEFATAWKRGSRGEVFGETASAQGFDRAPLLRWQSPEVAVSSGGLRFSVFCTNEGVESADVKSVTATWNTGEPVTSVSVHPGTTIYPGPGGRVSFVAETGVTFGTAHRVISWAVTYADNLARRYDTLCQVKCYVDVTYGVGEVSLDGLNLDRDSTAEARNIRHLAARAS